MNARNKKLAIAAGVAAAVLFVFTYFRMPSPRIAGLTRPTLTLTKAEATPAPAAGRPAAPGRPAVGGPAGAAGDKGAAQRPAYRAKTPEERREAAKKRREEMMARRRAMRSEPPAEGVGAVAPSASRVGRVGPRTPAGRTAAGIDSAAGPGGKVPPGGDLAPLEELDAPPPEHGEGEAVPDEEVGGEIE
jgi:hypothetical protein